MPVFKTIRQTAATGLISEYRLRLLVAAGQIPGFKVGNRFMVNVTAFAEMMDKLSRERKGIDNLENVGGDGKNEV